MDSTAPCNLIRLYKQITARDNYSSFSFNINLTYSNLAMGPHGCGDRFLRFEERDKAGIWELRNGVRGQLSRSAGSDKGTPLCYIFLVFIAAQFLISGLRRVTLIKCVGLKRYLFEIVF